MTANLTTAKTHDDAGFLAHLTDLTGLRSKVCTLTGEKNRAQFFFEESYVHTLSLDTVRCVRYVSAATPSCGFTDVRWSKELTGVIA